MNQEDILAVLPESRDDAKSLKEIALAMELELWLCGPGAQTKGGRAQVLV